MKKCVTYSCPGFFIQVTKLDWYSSIMLHSTDVALTTVLSILAIVDIVGNCLVCAIIKQNPVMRYVESEMHVINNDILLALNKGVKANNNHYINKLSPRRFSTWNRNNTRVERLHVRNSLWEFKWQILLLFTCSNPQLKTYAVSKKRSRLIGNIYTVSRCFARVRNNLEKLLRRATALGSSRHWRVW